VNESLWGLLVQWARCILSILVLPGFWLHLFVTT
jgi:hypothetical protein